MKKINSYFISLLAGLVFFSVQAVPVQQSGFEKANHYIDHGVFIGGFEHGVLSLNSMRRNFDKDSKVERLVLEVSSGKTEKVPERPGFYHISLQKEPKRVLIDLHNVVGEKSEMEKYKKLIEQSRYFSTVKFFQDPFTKSMTLELPIRSTVKSTLKVEVFELASLGQHGRIVIDIKEF